MQIGSKSDSTYHIDRDSIQTRRFTSGGTYVAAWWKIDYHQAQELSYGKKYWQTKIFDYYDCVARKTAYDYAVIYDKQDNYVYSSEKHISTYSSKDWNRVVPDTVGEHQLDYVCSQAGQ